MAKNRSNLTKQGIRNLNENFGPRPKRNEIPDNCTLGIHDWSDWVYFNGGYQKVRTCLNCEDQDRMHCIPTKVQKPFKATIKDAVDHAA